MSNALQGWSHFYEAMFPVPKNSRTAHSDVLKSHSFQQVRADELDTIGGCERRWNFGVKTPESKAFPPTEEEAKQPLLCG